MSTASAAHFDRQYQRHLKHLKLKGRQPKTIEAYMLAPVAVGTAHQGRGVGQALINFGLH